MDKRTIEAVLAGVQNLKALVVGDFFLDRYLDIDRALDEESVETGLAAYQVVGKRLFPGAAGNVVANLKAMGVGEVICLGAVGSDGEGLELRRALEGTGARTDLLITSDELFTPTYTKPMSILPGQPPKEMSRLDIKNRRRLPASIEKKLIESLRELLPQVDAVAVCDQVEEENCGIVTDAIRDQISSLAGANDASVVVDSRGRIGRFRNVALKPNFAEASRALGEPCSDLAPSLEMISAMSRRLADSTGCRVFLTAGENGMLVAYSAAVSHVPACPVDGEIDIVGAGDSCLAGIIAACGLGESPENAARLGCLVASITVRKIGQTGTASPDELRASAGACATA